MTKKFGWTPNPAGVNRVLASLPHPGVLAAAAPDWMGDGLEGDLMPYLAYYETEHDWGGSDEPPYINQPGNDCTAEALARVNDLLQILESGHSLRTCIETSYAFGLYTAGLVGDGGCYGAAMAKAASDIGFVPYRDVPGAENINAQPDSDRLQLYASDPAAVVERYSELAAKYRMGEIFLVKTWNEYCAGIANKALFTVASTIGYDSPRDRFGICEANGYWPHQMAAAGVIRSDGHETAVILQSYGPNTPQGPRPHRLPSFGFRVHRRDFEAQLAAGDTWGFRMPTHFASTPLQKRYTNEGWAA